MKISTLEITMKCRWRDLQDAALGSSIEVLPLTGITIAEYVN